MTIQKNNPFQMVLVLLSKIFDKIFEGYSPYTIKDYKLRGDNDWHFTFFGTIFTNVRNFIYSLCCKSNCILNYHLYFDEMHQGYFTNMKDAYQYVQKNKSFSKHFEQLTVQISYCNHQRSKSINI